MESRGYGTVKELLESGLEEISRNYPDEAEILKLRFKKDKTIISVAHELNFSTDQINRIQRSGIGRIAENLMHEEKSIREARATYLSNNLPPRISSKLFGFEDPIKLISDSFLENGGPSVCVISGLGGIGKTSLADAVARKILNSYSFDNFIWIRNENHIENSSDIDGLVNILCHELYLIKMESQTNEELVALALKTNKYLVVLDNFGSETNIDRVVKKMSKLSGISKFLLTSRRHPSKNDESFNYRVSELDMEDAKKILVHQTEKIGLGKHKQEIIEHLDNIYSVIGGNPLALKLFVGLLEALPLSILLDDFKKTKLEDIKSLYSHIYLLSWVALDDLSKKVLLGMIQSSDYGFTFENMVSQSGLGKTETTKSIQSLFNRSLLEWRGGLEDRRYGIHRLTHAFLENDILNDETFRI